MRAWRNWETRQVWDLSRPVPAHAAVSPDIRQGNAFHLPTRTRRTVPYRPTMQADAAEAVGQILFG